MLVVVVAATALAAMAQTVAGFGFALIAVPFYVTVLEVSEAVGAVAVLSFVNVAMVARSVRGHAPWPTVRYLLAGSICAMPFGLVLLLSVSGDVLRIAVGTVSILMAAAIGAGFTLHAAGRVGTFFVGAASGVLCTSIAINGPPVVLFLQALRHPPEVFRAAISTFFMFNGLVSLSIFAFAGVVSTHSLGISLTAFPALLVGHWIGHRLLPRFSPETFRRFVLALLVVSASTSLIDGLLRTFG
ncbi:MAG: sulfite exporter TauE/SafE family protein [Candidatus Binatia bacterium]|nr:sulfite exporter TauE/SafE family protein [Candidatus Binatia bacterium]